MGWVRRILGLDAPTAPVRRPYAHRGPSPVVSQRLRDPDQVQNRLRDADRARAAGERPRDPAMGGERSREPRLTPGQAFTPTQPKPGSRQVTGRQAELQRILQGLNEDRAHVVLYSERGRGKTSLSNMIVEALRRAGVIVARHTCDAGSDFDSIIRGLMRDLPHSLQATAAPAMGEGCEAILSDQPMRPSDVLAIPGKLTCRSLVCLVDEFDRVENSRTRTQLADAIKQLSDRDVPLLFLVVGVSENLDEIIGQHPSIQRSVLGVHLPLFTDRDVAQLIAKGGKESGFSFPQDAVARITVLSRGMPYMAQLLGLRLTQAASDRGSAEVSEQDFDTAVARMVADANPRIVALHASLTVRGRDTEMIQALRRIATAPQDAWGRIEIGDLPNGGALVAGRRVGQAQWQRLVEAGVLAPVSGSAGLFVFAERGLMHHVLLLAARDIATPEIETLEQRSTQAAGGAPVLMWPPAANA